MTVHFALSELTIVLATVFRDQLAMPAAVPSLEEAFVAISLFANLDAKPVRLIVQKMSGIYASIWPSHLLLKHELLLDSYVHVHLPV